MAHLSLTNLMSKMKKSLGGLAEWQAKVLTTCKHLKQAGVSFDVSLTRCQQKQREALISDFEASTVKASGHRPCHRGSTLKFRHAENHSTVELLQNIRDTVPRNSSCEACVSFRALQLTCFNLQVFILNSYCSSDNIYLMSFTPEHKQV